MNKRYAAAVMAALAMAGTVHAQTADQKLRSYETWGSVMGDFNGVSGKDVTYFGANGQPVAEVNYDAYQDGTFEPSGYTYYGYDDNGRVVKEWSQEYKIGTGNVMEWKDKDSIVYQYNDAGYLVSERNYQLGDSTAYEYDADGNKVAMVKYLPDYQGGSPSCRARHTETSPPPTARRPSWATAPMRRTSLRPAPPTTPKATCWRS